MKPHRPPTIDPDTWTLYTTVCTSAELVALELEARGLSQNTIALYLNVSRSSIRNRLDNARRKIAIAQTTKENAA